MLNKSKQIISTILVFMLMIVSIFPQTASAQETFINKNGIEVSILEDNDNVKIAEYENENYKYIAIQNKDFENINIKIIDKNDLDTLEEYIFENEHSDENGRFKGNLVNLETEESIYLNTINSRVKRFAPAIPLTIEIVKLLIAGIVATAAVNLTVVAASDVSNVLIKKFKDKKPNVIYRFGSGSNTNLTPRPVDKTGLSYTTTKPLKGYTATSIQAINASGQLIAVQDGANHVSVKPINMKKMSEWINSRANAEKKPHLYTKLLRTISLRVK